MNHNIHNTRGAFRQVLISCQWHHTLRQHALHTDLLCVAWQSQIHKVGCVLPKAQTVNWPVITEVRSFRFGLVTGRRHDIHVLCAVTHTFAYWTSFTVMHVIVFYRWVWCRTLSLHYARAMRVFDIQASSSPAGYLCAKFFFFRGLHCWASPWRKSHTQSLTQSFKSLTQVIWCPGNRSKSRKNMTETKMVESQRFWMWSAPEVNQFQGSMSWVPAINLAKICRLVYETHVQNKRTYNNWLQTEGPTHRQTQPST